MPNTPLGYINYPQSGNEDWYSGGDGLENWLLRAELLGIPTYQSFSDLPTAGSTEVVNPGTGQDQRQFAAVIDDLTVYRDNGTSWVAWMNLYTDSEAVSAINAETSLDVDITGDANSVDGYDVQKNGTDGAGIINFNTNDNEITIDGEIVVPEPVSTWDLETWEGGSADQTWETQNFTISSSRAYEGDYAAYATAGGGNQRAYDYENSGNNHSRYHRYEDKVRAFFYHPTSSANMDGTTRARWGYGGDWGNNYVVQWGISSEAVRIWKDGTGTSIAGPATITYPGGEWWAIESEWSETSPHHTARVMNYSDPNNPVVESELTADDLTIDDTSSGHYWGAWNSDSQGDMWVDRAHFYDE